MLIVICALDIRSPKPGRRNIRLKTLKTVPVPLESWETLPRPGRATGRYGNPREIIVTSFRPFTLPPLPFRRFRLVMSIGNQKFGIPRKYQNKIGIWYFCHKFLGIFSVSSRYFEESLVKIWLNIVIFGRIKIDLVFGFCSCHFIGIGLVSV